MTLSGKSYGRQEKLQRRIQHGEIFYYNDRKITKVTAIEDGLLRLHFEGDTTCQPGNYATVSDTTKFTKRQVAAPIGSKEEVRADLKTILPKGSIITAFWLGGRDTPNGWIYYMSYLTVHEGYILVLDTHLAKAEIVHLHKATRSSPIYTTSTNDAATTIHQLGTILWDNPYAYPEPTIMNV